MKTTTHTDTTRAISHIAPATRLARSRAILFLAAACTLAPVATNADVTWSNGGPANVNAPTTATVSGATNTVGTITGTTAGVLLTFTGASVADKLTVPNTLNGYAGDIAVTGGTITLNGTSNSYSGKTTVSGDGVLVIGVNSLGTGVNTLSGGTVVFSGATMAEFNRNWTLDGTGTMNAPTVDVTVWHKGLISGVGGNLIKTGAGSLILYAANTYTGKTIVKEGRLYLRNTDAQATDSFAAIYSRGIYLENSAQLVTDNFNATIKLLASDSPTATVDLRARTLTVSGEESSTFAGVIGNLSPNSGNFIKSGASTLTLTNANTYTGATTINDTGALALSGAGAIATSSGVTLGATATFSIAGVTAGEGIATVKSLNGTDGTFVVLGGKTLAINGTDANTFAGTISGTGGKLTKAGNSTLTLSGANTYDGGTTISGGSVSIGADANLGENLLVAKNTLGGATLVLTGATTYARGWTLSGTATITNAVEATQSGALTGASANLTKSGNGKLTLSGANDYSGLTTVSGTADSILALSGVGTIAASSGLTLTGSAKFDISLVNGTGTGIKNLTGTANNEIVLGGKTLDVSGIGTFAGIISGEGGKFVKSGEGKLTLSNANNSYDGGTTISGGTLSITANAQLGTNDNPNDNILRGGTLELNNPEVQTVFLRGWTLDGTGTINMPTVDITAWQRGVLQGVNGNLVKTGVGTLILYAKNTYTGSTTIRAGKVYLREDGGVGLAASSGVWLEGSGQLVLDAADTSIRQLTSSSTSSIVDLRNRTLTIYGSEDSTFAGKLTGNDSGSVGALIKSGTGTLTLTHTNDYRGGTTVSGGTLSVSKDDALGYNISTQYNSITNSTLRFTGADNYGHGWTLGGNVTIDTDVAADQTWLLAGTGHLTKTGTGKLTLSYNSSGSNYNTYSGGTTITGGSVSITDDKLLGLNNDSKSNFLNGGTLILVGNMKDFTRNWTLAQESTINTPTASNSAWFKGVIQDYANYLNEDIGESPRATGTGGADLIKTGAGNLIFYAENTYTGKTIVREGRLYLRNLDSLATESFAVINTRGIYLENSTFLTLDQVNAGIKLLASDSATTMVDLRAKTLTIFGEESSTFAGIIENTDGNGNLTKSGASTLTLTNANTYTGATTISGTGTLALSGAGSIATSSGVSLAESGKFSIAGVTTGEGIATVKNLNGTGGTFVILGEKTLAINGTVANNFAGTISGTGGKLTKAGTSALTLSGANTYDGGTTISGGSVSIGADANLGTNLFAVNNTLSGATLVLTSTTPYTRAWTLTGTGTISTDAEATQSGVLTGLGGLTKGGDGKLTLSGVNDYAGATNVGTGVLALSGDGSIAGSTGLTLTSTAKFDVSGITDSTTLKNLTGASTNEIVLGGKTLNVSGTGTFAGVISGEGGKFVKSGEGKLTLSNANNSYDGGTTISGGTLSITANAQLGTNDNPNANILRGGILEFNNSASQIVYSRGWTLDGTGTINMPTTDVTAWQQGVLQELPQTKGNLLKTGAGTLILYADNTYTGSTTVSAGKLYLRGTTGNAIAASSGLWLENSAQLTLDTVNSRIRQLTGTANTTVDLRAFALTIFGDEDSTFAGTITNTTSSANGRLIKSGSGTLTLTHANSYDGGTTISGGAISINADNRLGTSAAALSSAYNFLSGGTLILAGATTYSRNWTLTGSNTIHTDVAAEQNGLLKGTGSLTKTGTGKLTLGYSNTYSGGTTITAGTLSIVGNTNLGTTTVASKNFLNGGTLDLAGESRYKYETNWTLSKNSTINVTTSGYSAYQYGIIQDYANLAEEDRVAGMVGVAGATLTKTGAGNLMFYSVNTYTGSTIVSAGRLYLREEAGNAIAASNGVWLEGSAQLVTDSYDSRIQRVTSASKTATVDLRSFALTIFGDENSAFDGLVISGATANVGALVKSGNGTLTLTNTNTYKGGTTISGGTVSIAKDDNLGSNIASAYNSLGGGTLKLTGATTYARNWTLTGNGTISTDVDAIQGGLLKGASGSLTKTGTGKLTLSSESNSYGGGTKILDGTVSIAADINLGINNDAASNFLSGGTLEFTGSSASKYARGWTLVGTGKINMPTDGVTAWQQGVLQELPEAGSNLLKTGAGSLILYADNTYTGSTTVSAGRLYLRGDTGEAIAASSGVWLEGSAQLVLDTVNSRIRQLTSESASSIVDLRGFELTVFGEVSSTFDGTIATTTSSNGRLAKSGAGILTLTHANSYDGGTTISGGALSIGADNNLGSNIGAEFNKLSGGTLILTGTNGTDYTRGWTLDGTGGTIHTDKDVTQSGALTGTGGFTKSGSGTLTLTSGANDYSGGTTISGGALSIADDTDLGTNDAAASNTLNGGALVLTGTNDAEYTRAWTLAGTGGTIINIGAVEQSGLLTGGGSFTKDGVGTLTLTAANTYGGTTTVLAGTLILSGDGTISTGALTVATGATFDISDSTNLTVSTLNGSGTAAIVLGNKTLTVSGAIDFTGQITSSGTDGKIVGGGSSNITLTGDSVLTDITVVSGSTLRVNNNLKGVDLVNDGRVTITVEEKGILGGNGKITGDILVKPTGELSPGNSPDELTVAGNVTLEGGAKFVVEIDGTEGEKFDSVTLTGAGNVFTFDAFSIISVSVEGLLATSFDYQIITGSVSFDGGISSVVLDGPASWNLSLTSDESGLTLHGTQVPEPSTYALFGAIGAVALALIRRRKNKK